MMTVQLFSTSAKQLKPKPAYVKPVHKTYRELLQLDRPRKKIEYESSSSEEDFLERLLQEENEKSQKPKKKKKESKRAQTIKSQSKAGSKKDSKSGKQWSKGTPKDVLKDGEQFNIKARLNSKRSEQLNPEIAYTPQKRKTEERRDTEERREPVFMREAKSKVIMIDSKSKMEKKAPSVEYTIGHKLLGSSHTTKSHSGLKQLLKQKQQYRQANKLPSQVQCNPQTRQKHKVSHSVQNFLETKYSFAPNIQPRNPNWRFSMTVPPPPVVPKRSFTDRRTMFKNQEEEAIFATSLGDYCNYRLK